MFITLFYANMKVQVIKVALYVKKKWYSNFASLLLIILPIMKS